MPWKLFVFPARAVWPWHLTEVNKMPLQLCNYSYCKTVSSYCWFDETLTLYHLSDLHCYSNSAQTKTMVALLIFTIPSDCSRTYACEVWRIQRVTSHSDVIWLALYLNVRGMRTIIWTLPKHPLVYVNKCMSDIIFWLQIHTQALCGHGRAHD